MEDLWTYEPSMGLAWVEVGLPAMPGCCSQPFALLRCGLLRCQAGSRNERRAAALQSRPSRACCGLQAVFPRSGPEHGSVTVYSWRRPRVGPKAWVREQEWSGAAWHQQALRARGGQRLTQRSHVSVSPCGGGTCPRLQQATPAN